MTKPVDEVILFLPQKDLNILSYQHLPEVWLWSGLILMSCLNIPTFIHELQFLGFQMKKKCPSCFLMGECETQMSSIYEVLQKQQITKIKLQFRIGHKIGTYRKQSITKYITQGATSKFRRYRDRGIAQWYSTCLTQKRPQSLAHKKRQEGRKCLDRIIYFQ